MTDKLTIADYPLAETASHRIKGARGKPLDALTPDAVAQGEVTIEDLRITASALRAQAEIARAASRPTLAQNFDRGAELVAVPQDLIMATYEMLRPGRAPNRQALLDQAAMFRREHGADDIASFLEAAADHYLRRGLVRE